MMKENNTNQVIEEILTLLDQLKSKGVSPTVFLCPVEGYTIHFEKIGVPVRILKKDDIQSEI